MSQEYSFSLFGPRVRAGICRGEMDAQKMTQVHGTTVVEILARGPELEADALWTRQVDLRLAVKTADCIPLAFADEKAGLVAVVHAGWRGLTADIIPKTLVVLKEAGAEMSRLKVAVGPSLGTECAVFSDPLSEIPEKYHWAIEGNRVDLNGIARKQLMDAGVQVANIEWLEICTACDLEWPSWRRDHTAERFWTFIELEPTP